MFTPISYFVFIQFLLPYVYKDNIFINEAHIRDE